jgi:hypothetical protein
LQGWATQPEFAKMVGSDQTLDARRTARDHDARSAAASNLMLNAMKPIVQFQTACLRSWGDVIELTARNFEKGLEAFAGGDQQQQTHHQQ